MAQRTDAQLTTEKDIIMNETVTSANSATRIGTMIENLNDSKINNDKIDTDAALNTSGKTLAGRDALKTYIANVLAGITALTADDIDTLAEINAILTDANLVSETALTAALADKIDAETTPQPVTGAFTLNGATKTLVDDGANAEVQGNSGGPITIPLNATIDMPVGRGFNATGFTGNILGAVGVTMTFTRGDAVFPVGGTAYFYQSATDTWQIDNGLPDASETVKGLVELATQAETHTGTDDVRVITPLKLATEKDATGGIVGLTLFKINFKNVANTFISFFTNTNTAARTYTFQDRNGTIADDTDLALKAPLAGSKVIQVAVSDELTALTTGNAKVTFRMPYAMTLTAVRASLSIAQATGSILTIDINESGSTILSTKLTIDDTEKTSTTADVAAVISDTALADDAEITIDIDQVGDGTAKGLKITLIGS